MSLEVQYFPVLINKKEKIITAADNEDDEHISNLEDTSLNLDKNEEIKEEEIKEKELEKVNGEISSQK